MDYLVIGAGPAGLQLGYFLARAGRDYQILEAKIRVDESRTVRVRWQRGGSILTRFEASIVTTLAKRTLGAIGCVRTLKRMLAGHPSDSKATSWAST